MLGEHQATHFNKLNPFLKLEIPVSMI